MEMNLWINRVWNFKNQTGIWRNYCMELNLGAEEYIEGEMPKYIEDVFSEREAIPDGVVVAVDISDPLKEMDDATIVFSDKSVWILYFNGANVVVEKIETDENDIYFFKAVKELFEEAKKNCEDKLCQFNNLIECVTNRIKGEKNG